MGNQTSNLNGSFDPYEVLELERNASTDQINNSFRKKAKFFHPDLNRGKQNYKEIVEKYKQICIAFELISSDSNRIKYNESVAVTHEQIKKEHKCEPVTKEETDKFVENIQNTEYSRTIDRDYKRMSEKDLVGGKRNDTCDSPVNLFQGNFCSDNFNKLFEQQKIQTQGALIERTDPSKIEGFSMGNGNYSEIAIYDGLIVDNENEDGSVSNSKDYSDYYNIYGNVSNPTEFDKSTLNNYKLACEDTEELSEKKAQERLRTYQSDSLEMSIPKGERSNRYQTAQQQFANDRESKIAFEKEKQKRMVERYAKTQYNFNLPY